MVQRTFGAVIGTAETLSIRPVGCCMRDRPPVVPVQELTRQAESFVQSMGELSGTFYSDPEGRTGLVICQDNTLAREGRYRIPMVRKLVISERERQEAGPYLECSLVGGWVC